MRCIYGYLTIVSLTGLMGCASDEAKIKTALSKNPQLLFEVIEQHPEEFLESVNRAAHKAQQKQYEKRISDMRSQQELELKNPKKPSIDEERILHGSSKAPVTVVEYADFECPACKLAQNSLQEFKKKYPDKVKFVYKNMPLSFHKMALPSAKYFEAVRLQGRDKAVRFHKMLFDNQEKLSEQYLEKAAKHVGADMKRLRQDINSEKVAQIVEADKNEFESFGFTGTPVLIVNGVTLYGAQPIEEIERVMKLTQE